MALGDKVVVIIDLGGGYTREEEVVATVSGGSVSIEMEGLWTAVTEHAQPPRGQDPLSGDQGPVVREVRVRRESVIALIETPRRGR